MSATEYHNTPYSKMSLFQRAQMFNDGFSPSTDPSEFSVAAQIFLEGIPIGPLNEQEVIKKVRKLMTISTELRPFYEVVIEQISLKAIASKELQESRAKEGTPILDSPRFITGRGSSPKEKSAMESNSTVLGNSRVTKTTTNRRAIRFAEKIEASTKLRNSVSKVFEARYAAWAAEQTKKINSGESFEDLEEEEEEEGEEEEMDVEERSNKFDIAMRSASIGNRGVFGDDTLSHTD